MHRTIFTCSVAALLINAQGGAYGASLEVVSSFSTPEHILPPLSIALDPGNNTLLLGGGDGSVTEVDHIGTFLEQVIPAGLLRGYYPPADRGLAFISSPPLLYCSGGPSLTLLNVYTRSGEFLLTYVLSGQQMYQGLYFDENERTLYGLNRFNLMISAWPLTDSGYIPFARKAYNFVAPNDERWDVTGIVVMAEEERFLVSLKHAELVVLAPNVAPPEQHIVRCEVKGRTSLQTQGIMAVDDIAWNRAQQRLFVTDPSQMRVFELAFVPSAPFHRGDSNDDGSLDVADAVHLLSFLVLGGPEPGCLASGDSNGDRKLEVSDAVFLLLYLFSGGPEPPTPGPPAVPCGPETDPGEAVLGLGCGVYRSC